MTMTPDSDLSTLLRLSPDLFYELGDGAAGVETHRERIHHALRDDARARELFAAACCFESPYGESWIHQQGDGSPYLSLELAATALDLTGYRSLLVRIVLSTSASLPYDYRALAAERLLAAGFEDHRALLEEAAADAVSPRMRDLRAKALIRTDGIDHLFDIPGQVEQRLALLARAAELRTRETRSLLAARVLAGGLRESGNRPEALASSHLSARAEQLIAEDTGCDMVDARDYLVPWDQVVPTGEVPGAELTLAELLRIVLLCPEFKLPDATVRPALIAFYRAVLRTSGRSIIGLGAGVFHVEHGTAAYPSYFYLGRDAVLGKGCVVDCVGGAVIQRGSFLGGGFMPILIHTHKHVRAQGEPGVAERKQVLPCVFAAEAGARLPMSAIGLFETADHLDTTVTPFAGIRALPLD
ncbi:hypothetical protein ACIHAA_01890 [Streptomyces sp. NPDC052040]|uniref:hypothetical protein n=1 Tax=unclassified Streptomyces TaxID=2593676 RepID=UPI0037D658AD